MQTQRQEHAGAGRGRRRGMQEPAEAEADRSNRSQSAPARASQGQQMQIYVGKEVGMVLKKKMLRQVFLFLDFAVFRKSNRVNLPFIGKTPGWILFVTNISECVRF